MNRISFQGERGAYSEAASISFFEGEIEAWGIVEDRFGNLKRQFKVEMHGIINNDVLTLEEDFYYADGDIDKRVGSLAN